MKIKSLKTKIMLFIVSLMVIVSVFTSIYFPMQQSKSLTADYSALVKDRVEMFGISLELALAGGDMSKVDRVFDYAKSDKRIKFIVLLSDGEVFSSYPKDLKFDVKTYNKADNLIVQTTDIKTDIIQGKVVVGMTTDHIQKEIQSSFYTAVIIGLISIVISILIAIFISNKITKPIFEAKDAALKIANGDLNVQIDNTTGDETGELIDSMKLMITNLRKVDEQMREIAVNVESGNLSYKSSSEGFNGSWKDTIEGITHIVERLVRPINVMSEKINLLSNGTLPDEVTQEMKGDFNTPKLAINKLINILRSFDTDMEKMNEDHNQGYINNYIDAKKYEGIFRDIATGVIINVKSHIQTKKDVLKVFEGFSKGDFEADVEKLANDKAFINHGIDTIRSVFKQLSSEIEGLVEAAKNGDLHHRADAHAFDGAWKVMVEELNTVIAEIASPLQEASGVLADLADGYLGVKMNGEYNGEYENLKSNINHLSATLQGVLSSLIESVESSAATANQLSQTADNMSASAQEQSAQTDDVASAIEEMSQTITENASSATRTAGLAEENGQIAQKGSKVVDDTVVKMKDIAKVVKNTSLSISKLGESSKEIGEIILVIDDIADQTNLLALNAAIEAARAGEQGRGFAVVADEVRKLAERTSDATKEIAKMIKGIQQETEDAVSVMHTGTMEVENGIHLADEAGQSLRLIVESSQELISMITQISAASEEQSATAEQVSKNVMAISRVVSDSAMQISEIADSSVNLSKQTDMITQMLGQFKLDSERSDRALNSSRNNTKLLSKKR